MQNTVKRTETPTEFSLLTYRLQNTEYDIRHIPYTVEKRLFAAVRHGSLTDLRDLISADYQGYSLGSLAKNSQKNAEYQAVVTISLIARAAIEGGLDPYAAYDLNDLYLQKISVSSSPSDYRAITADALVRYCKQVSLLKEQATPSLHISKCKHYVATHLNKAYCMQELADYVGLSPKYLGDLFRKTEGQTLKSYILRSRIDAAKNMLKYSDFSIARIANYFCFDTQSHFGATFRRFEGTSPSEYRKRNKPLNF